MATDLLVQFRERTLNSRIGIERSSQTSETETSLAIVSVLSAETETQTEAEEIIGAGIPVPGQRHGSEIILLVEDEAFVRKVTAEVLESAGYKLIIAGSGTEALQACRRCPEPVDLLLADVVMPGMNGRELATQFVLLYPRAQVLLMTGYAKQLAFSDLAPVDKKYLAKPFTIRMLLGRVRELLDAYRPALQAQP
jgi:CheY-like chemotaxis protein